MTTRRNPLALAGTRESSITALLREVFEFFFGIAA